MSIRIYLASVWTAFWLVSLHFEAAAEPAAAGMQLTPPPIKVGVVLALSGDLAQLGTDMRNALTLISEKIGGGRYRFLFEDDQCQNTAAVSIARKFIEVDKVTRVFGFACNQTLMATAPIYERAGVLAVSGSGTSGDTPFIGKHVFRFFPADYFGADRLFRYMRTRLKSLTILSEQTEYAEMMDRSFQRFNKDAGSPLTLENFSFHHDDPDLRSLLTRIRGSASEAIYINADSDSSFITILKQLDALHFRKPRYSVYLPASASVLAAVPGIDEGIVFSNLPSGDGMLSEKGKSLIKEFRARFGEPQSGFPVVPTTFEAFRMLDLAVRSGQDPADYLRGRAVDDGYMPPYRMDENGNIAGLKFEMQQIKGGKAELLEK